MRARRSSPRNGRVPSGPRATEGIGAPARGDLQRWAGAVATDLADPDVLALMRAAVGSGPDGGCARIADRQAQVTAILEREESRGGQPPTMQRAADTILGPLYFRAIFIGEPAEPGWARELVAALLR